MNRCLSVCEWSEVKWSEVKEIEMGEKFDDMLQMRGMKKEKVM